MRPSQYTQSLNSEMKYKDAANNGFTVLELLVAFTITSVAMVSLLTFSVYQRDNFISGFQRTSLQQDLISSVNFVGSFVRQSGEELGEFIPAILISPDTSGSSDELVLRKSVIPEVATICKKTNKGAKKIFISNPNSKVGVCKKTNVEHITGAFRGQRNKQINQIDTIFIYDHSTKVGEFVVYKSEGISRDGNSNFLRVSDLKNEYTPENSNVYYLEEYRFNLNADEDNLELIIDQDFDNPKKVAFGVNRFEIEAILKDGTNTNNFNEDSPNSWKEIKSINIEIEGEKNFKGRLVNETVTGSFMPRNVLSE